MSKFASIFQKLLAASLILLSLNSCDPGCVEAYEFDTESTFVDSRPYDDGIFGNHYDDQSGGEIAGWHNTGLRTDGGPLTFEISGAWTAWSDAGSDSQLQALRSCTICFKKAGVSNCLCETGQEPAPEKDSLGNVLTGVNCSGAGGNFTDQNDPTKCTCTKQAGVTTTPDVYAIALDYQSKDESMKIPDEQEACKFSQGIGLYVGLFGQGGYTMPTRLYHIHPTSEICDIPRNLEGKCIDLDGHDQTKYLYTSPNNTIFMKDDKAGNNGTDTDPSDDTYHTAGEYIKFIINDRYYTDNFGGYDVNFMGGFIRQDGNGLLEFVVGSVEDAVMGKISVDTGKREGGAIEFLYNSIVKDSVFIAIVQMCLVMYVVLFGIFVLAGALEISRKELSMRVLKIGLVIFFTTESSWYFYNQIVIGFFKDSMDSVISIFMAASDKTVDPSSLVVTSQLDRAHDVSQATRFAYVDVMIRKFYTTATAKKILSLVFGDFFGILYAPIIYILIFAFTYVMVFAALMYVRMFIGLIFVLCLGPIFMITILFSKTKKIFSRWLTYLAAQSLQIIALFLIVYLFAVILDKAFNDMLYYRACTTNINFGLFNINFLVSEIDRSMGAWLLLFVKIGALLFLLRMLMEQIPGFIGHLVVISGQSADTSRTYASGTSGSATGLAKDLFGKIGSGAMMAWKNRGLGGGVGMARDLAGRALRSTGMLAPVDYLRNKSPVRSPFTWYNDRELDKIIKTQQGKNPKDVEKVRAESLTEARKRGFSEDSIMKRMDQKLVVDPIKKAIKEEVKKLKTEGDARVLLDQKALRSEIADRLKSNKSIDASRVGEVLADQKTSVSIGTRTAAKSFYGDEGSQAIYMQRLKAKQLLEAEAGKSYLGSGINKLKKITGYDAKSKEDRFHQEVASRKRQEELNKTDKIDLLRRAVGGVVERSPLVRKAIYKGYNDLVAAVGNAKYDNKVDAAKETAARVAKEMEDATANEIVRQRYLAEAKALEAAAAEAEASKKKVLESGFSKDISGAQSQVAQDNTASQQKNAEELKAALKKYNDDMAKLALWQEMNNISGSIRELSAKPETDDVKKKISDLEKQKFDVETKMKNI